ncbi:chemotaxis protein CheW [Heyndrickxia shackletonii]|uniref:Chemotaxis protein CheW n=1 Tax=Heyndrickxia shackletonii TaxID=157838 RepID=A0A0Q3WYN8_9BACI|nr:chemotaxis protein CheW [Heyndrickxia shackletonii]KQL54613.1 chemotaxis protein CheW [Heyndrickxia shackletonii]MBB2478647.1 chemotaxis protein CheW [Bacillus sp. APMAM]NEY98258.1 chemotaxis protein CheW [Heyndrickxia shackletonii]RTZ57790.1 chemotaxis protein CheW [Bacillus sp. SAJ1]
MMDVVEQTENKMIVFQLKGNEYAIPVGQVRAIERVLHITRVPNTASFIKGVINLRGVIIPIIDLQNRLGIGEIETTEKTRMIIVSMDNIEVGLMVDSANDVIDIPMESIEPQPEVVNSVKAEFISNVANLNKRLIMIMSLEKIVSPLI